MMKDKDRGEGLRSNVQHLCRPRGDTLSSHDLVCGICVDCSDIPHLAMIWTRKMNLESRLCWAIIAWLLKIGQGPHTDTVGKEGHWRFSSRLL